jgi:hypothetical protein
MAEQREGRGERRWTFRASNPEEFRAVDRATCNGSIERRMRLFEDRSLPRQRMLLDWYLKRCKASNFDSYVCDCSGVRFRFWVYEAELSIMLLSLQSTLTGRRH